jgi:hypothetical protein
MCATEDPAAPRGLIAKEGIVHMAKSVEDLLQDIRLLGEEQFQIVEAVRSLVARAISPLTEEVKYGGIMFSSGVSFCGVFAYKGHVSVEFGSGARIRDEHGFLEGGGKGRRHVKLERVEDVTVKKLEEYLPLALRASRSGV